MQLSDHAEVADSSGLSDVIYDPATLSSIQSSSWLSDPVRAFRSLYGQTGLAAAFLVAVPVFVQAPMVRLMPLLSLALTGLWLGFGFWLVQSDRAYSSSKSLSPSQLATLQVRNRLLGELIIGFSWTWLAGGIYWGWFRTNPYLHLPIEAVSLPIVLLLLRYGKANVGNYFYLGSLLGTAITDIYFYCVGLIPAWKALMVQPPSAAGSILHGALLRMGTYQGVGCAIVLLALLIMLGTIPLRTTSPKWWAFGGAVLSTILVDSLFFVAALLS